MTLVERIAAHPAVIKFHAFCTICHPAVVRRSRKVCERFAFLGASFDLAGYLGGEHDISALLGKLAFAIGALGVIILHVEERVNTSINK